MLPAHFCQYAGLFRFVTGASGFIGSAIKKELIGAGTSGERLARSTEAAKSISKSGREVVMETQNFIPIKQEKEY
ncbi:MAG: hypothetical protein QM762_04585 [Chryseolinea sp.]